MGITMPKLQIDLPSEIERAKKSIGNQSSILLPLVEAIKNSFQAGATKIEVNFPSSRQDIILDHSVTHYVNSYYVKDNGHGFTIEDIKAFESLRKKHNSNNKYKQGCKGYSRIVSLCYFEKISINSMSKDGNYKVDFSIEENIHNDSMTSAIIDKITFTEVKFINNRRGNAFYDNGECVLDLKTISNEIKEKLLIFISLLEGNFEIILSDFLNEKVTLTNEDFNLKLN